jgi:hypothetical protein
MTITRCKIHPAIGVARVGDSPDEYFIGPERPGRHEPPPGGHYKDRAGRIKRQAARFRVVGYDEHGEVVRELTAADAEIRWTVHLANRKAAAELFRPRDDRTIRNDDVPEADRRSLVIDPGPRSISGPDVGGAEEHRFDTGAFGAVPVDLGELRTDESGRLIVLGGHGRSASPTGQELGHFADNDGWFDDTSDGLVQATVRLTATGEELEVDPSWVIVAPPDFAPTIGNVVTLLDVVEQAAADARGLPEPTEVSFVHDILPLMRRAGANQWVEATAFRGHRRGDQDPTDATAVERRGDFSDQALLKLLADPARVGDAAEARRRVLDHIRAPLPPEGTDDQVALKRARNQATAAFMPPMSGDLGDRDEGVAGTWLSVTPRQYRRLELWADGDFAPTDPGVLLASTIETGAVDTGVAEPGAAEPTPADLDRAALENCVGGGFFPGIEVSRMIKDPERYLTGGSAGDRYRLDPAGLSAGLLTARMAVPWQADFAQCEGFWWPAQRPDHVVADEDYRDVRRGRSVPRRPGPFVDTLALPRRAWARGIGDRPLTTHSSDPVQRRRHDMVERWTELGFVVPQGRAKARVWTETERTRYFGLRDRDYFHIMLNLDDHRGFRPVARELAEWFLAEARHRIDHDKELDSELHPFTYDETTFATRLDSIYQFLADQVEVFDPADPDGTFRTRRDVIERIRQFGPLNLTDGAWLRNIGAIPPIPGVTDLLGAIWDDENGGPGHDERYNHAHLYAELMRSEAVGLHPAPVASLAYAQDPELLDSAFTAPLLQLVVSEFTEDFLPEILGMTLHFEWESVWLMANVKLFDQHGVDSTFYRVHLAIDNVAEGHGALATRAVKRYLDRFAGAEQQEQWRRVWTGYVAFRETGTLFADLRALVRPARKAILDRMVAMIERKKPFASLNHGRLAGSTMTNDLFDDPVHLLDVLKGNKKLVVPGQPDRSGLLELFAIDGAMYRVFTEEEQHLWRDWIESLGAPPAPATAPPPPPGPQHYSRRTLASPGSAFRADLRDLRGRGGVQ